MGAVLQLAHADRETLSHLVLTRQDASTLGLQLWANQTMLRGTLISADDLDGQVRELDQSGLVGGLSRTDTPDQLEIQLWAADEDQRQAWAARLARATTSEHGWQLLSAAGEWRWAQWRKDQAWARLQNAMVMADTAGIPKKVIGEIAGVRRGAVYEAVEAFKPIESERGLSASAPRATPPATPERPAPSAVATVRQEAPGKGELVRMPRERTAPCVMCGTPARELLDSQIPIHAGQCLINYREGTPRLTEQAAASLSSTSTDSPVSAPAAPAVLDAPTTPKKASSAAKDPSERFAAPAAVLDGEVAHLPRGHTQPWTAAHVGELALLVTPTQLRLGWGGGKTFPDEGQIWLTADALTRLGLPAEVLVAAPEEPLTREQLRKKAKTVMAKIAKEPAIADALAAGWQMGTRGLDAWTKIWHPELLPRGAWLVMLPWQRIGNVPLLEGEQPETYAAPAELARRLDVFARQVGISYRVTPPVTAMDLIDHTHPPRRTSEPYDRTNPALVRDQAPELPPFLTGKDRRFTRIEADFDWWRTWEALGHDERGRRFVTAWDRGKSYLSPWTNMSLGLEGLEHREGPAAAWDGTTKLAGYWLIDRWTWPDWSLPDPNRSTPAVVSGGRVWVSTPTLEQLRMVGIEPVVHEAWVWTVSARYLEVAGSRLREALTNTVDDRPVHQVIKALYRGGVGKFAQRDLPSPYHLARPDWNDHIIAATRTQILANLLAIRRRTPQAIPLLVTTDAIAFAVDEANPDLAWPGDPAKLGDGIGAWKPIGTADLATWGPKHLRKHVGVWPYGPAMSELKNPQVVGTDG